MKANEKKINALKSTKKLMCAETLNEISETDLTFVLKSMDLINKNASIHHWNDDTRIRIETAVSLLKGYSLKWEMSDEKREVVVLTFDDEEQVATATVTKKAELAGLIKFATETLMDNPSKYEKELERISKCVSMFTLVVPEKEWDRYVGMEEGLKSKFVCVLSKDGFDVRVLNDICNSISFKELLSMSCEELLARYDNLYAERHPNKMQVIISFSAEVTIEGESLEEIKSKWEYLDLFSEDAADCHAVLTGDIVAINTGTLEDVQL